MTRDDPQWPDEFGPFDGRLWWDCAHQGPLPKAAASAVGAALQLKISPHRLADDLFLSVPRQLKESLARLIGAEPGALVLGNSASYGLSVLVHGLRIAPGDEVLLVRGDFPATVMPWLPLGHRGVRVRLVDPAGPVLAPDDLRTHLTPDTRVVCTGWVNSFNGHVVALDDIGDICRQRGVRFVVNGSQGVGVRPLDVSAAPIDALISCGHKWLCGPYGTGFCWVRTDLLNELTPRDVYWLPHVWGMPTMDYSRRSDLGTAAFDVMGTANFLNFMPWRASVDLLLRIGVGQLHRHAVDLAGRLVAAVDPAQFRVLSPTTPAASSIVVLSSVDSGRNAVIHARIRASGIDASLRQGNLRFAPHLYNTREEAEEIATELNRAAEVTG